MRRFALALIVALLTFSASGASTVLVPEPCTGYEQAAQEDDVCPPICVTCGCCAQAVEPTTVAVTSAPDTSVADVAIARPRLVKTDPNGVLHVPKSPLA